MRFALLIAVVLPLLGCELVYKLPTRQGNVIEQKELDALQLGMTRDQVQFVLGTPVAASAFEPDRWDYFGYYKNPRGKVFSRTVSLYFQDDKLARIEGLQPPSDSAASTPDIDALQKEEKKAKTEDERAEEQTDTGIIIAPK